MRFKFGIRWEMHLHVSTNTDVLHRGKMQVALQESETALGLSRFGRREKSNEHQPHLVLVRIYHIVPRSTMNVK
jgi:hypothetical protein